MARPAARALLSHAGTTSCDLLKAGFAVDDDDDDGDTGSGVVPFCKSFSTLLVGTG